MSETSRRALLAGLSVAPVALAPAVHAASSAALHTLWNERRALRPVIAEKAALMDAAEAAMPWWARSGPSRLYQDGSTGGPQNGWPAIRYMESPQIEGAWRVLRPTLSDLQGD